MAVKVQYPGVREAIDHDLANVGMMIKLGGLVARGLDAGTIVKDLEAGIRAELDYVREAQWQERFANAFAGHAFIRVPRVIHGDEPRARAGAGVSPRQTVRGRVGAARGTSATGWGR
ncbi:MAG: AarF/UbiB family protein [Bifidobacterium adolescentis]